MSQLTVLTKKLAIKRNMESHKALTALMYNSGASENEVFKNSGNVVTQSTVSINSTHFEGTKAHQELSKKINALLDKRKAATDEKGVINAAEFSEADYYNLVNLTMINLNRRVLQQNDLTSFVDEEITDENFTKTVEFADFLPFGAIFKEHSGTGENVSLIVTEFGDKDTTKLFIKAVGWKDTLLNELFNQGLRYMERVLEAVAEGYVAARNDEAMNRILTITYDASQTQAAIASGATFEENMYLTIYEAIKKAKALLDPLTGDYIDSSDLALLHNPQNEMDLTRAINGVISSNPAAQVNRTSLLNMVQTLVPYKQKTIRNGKETKIYPGVALNKAYLFVPKAYRYTLVKRGLTQQISTGAALKLDREDKAWYYVQGRYDDLFFGSSDAGVKAACNTRYKGTSGEGFGFIIEIDLPTS